MNQPAEAMDVEANVIDELEIDVTLVLARALLLLLERLKSIEYRNRLVLENVRVQSNNSNDIYSYMCCTLYCCVIL